MRPYLMFGAEIADSTLKDSYIEVADKKASRHSIKMTLWPQVANKW